MCSVCGCGQDNSAADRVDAEGGHHAQPHQEAHHHHYGHNAAGVSVAGFSDTRLIEIDIQVMPGASYWIERVVYATGFVWIAFESLRYHAALVRRAASQSSDRQA